MTEPLPLYSIFLIVDHMVLTNELLKKKNVFMLSQLDHIIHVKVIINLTTCQPPARNILWASSGCRQSDVPVKTSGFRAH